MVDPEDFERNRRQPGIERKLCLHPPEFRVFCIARIAVDGWVEWVEGVNEIAMRERRRVGLAPCVGVEHVRGINVFGPQQESDKDHECEAQSDQTTLRQKRAPRRKHPVFYTT